MSIQRKTVYQASDGTQFDSEEEARDYQVAKDLVGPVHGFLTQRGVKDTSRVRGTTVAGLLVEFSVILMTPGRIEEFSDERTQDVHPDPQGPAEAGETDPGVED